MGEKVHYTKYFPRDAEYRDEEGEVLSIHQVTEDYHCPVKRTFFVILNESNNNPHTVREAKVASDPSNLNWPSAHSPHTSDSWYGGIVDDNLAALSVDSEGLAEDVPEMF